MTETRLDRAIWHLAPGEGSPRWMPRLVTGIWLLCVVVGVFYALIQPVWSVVDEGPHFGYVELVGEQFQFPRAGETLVSEQVLAIGRDRQWGWQYPRDGSLKLEGDEAPVGTGRADESQWVRGNLWRFNYEAIQPPLYYLISAAVYRLTPGSALDRVYAVRILSAILASLNVLIAYRIARRISPKSRILQIGAPASFVLLQGYMFNLSQVTNDALAAPMGGLMILLMVRAIQDNFERRDAMLVGFALGLALLTKSVLWSMPFVMTIVFLRQFGLRKAFRYLKWIAGISGVVFVPWLIRNLFVYGDATGQSTMSRFLGTFFPAQRFVSPGEIWNYMWTATRHMILSYAWGEPVWVWAYRAANVIAAYALLLFVAAGWAAWYFHKRRMRAKSHHPSAERDSDDDDAEKAELTNNRHQPAPLLERPGMWVCGLTVLVSYLFLLVLPMLGGIAVVGRYMYPVSAAVAVGVTFGAARVVPRPKLRVAFLVLIAVAFLTLNVINLVGWRDMGLTTSRVADGIAYSDGATKPSTVWYFAGGRNEGGFTQQFTIFNPAPLRATATLSYFIGGGTVSRRSVEVPPGESVVVNTRLDRAGGAGAGHLSMGTMIEADVPVVAERGEYFFVSDRGWNGGSIVAGRPSLTSEGFFAAGRVGGGWSEVLSFLNPGEDSARVTIEYLADGRMREASLVVPARSPARVDVGSRDSGALGEPAERLSVRIQSSVPIAMERQLYRSGDRYAGGDWAASSVPSPNWTFPLVQSGPGYHPTLVVMNPSGSPGEVRLRYHLGDGRVEERLAPVPVGRTDMDLEVAAGPGIGVVGSPFVLEASFNRDVIVELETSVRDSGYVDLLAQPGSTRASERWYFATGSTQPDFTQRMTIFNPSSQAQWVRLRYFPGHPATLPTVHQPPVEKSVKMSAGEVLTIDVENDALGVGANQDLSVVIDADSPVFAGRMLYFIHSF